MNLNMDVFVQSLVSGLFVGFVYGVIGVCIGIVFNATKIMNFAQGDFLMIGGVAGWLVATHWGLPYVLAVAAGGLAGGITGVVTERVVLAPARRRRPPLWTFVFLLFGVHYVLSEIVGISWIGRDPLPISSPLGTSPLKIGSAAVSRHYLVLVPASIVLLFLLIAMFRYTAVGRSMRAAAINPVGAQVVGIRVGSIALTAFALSGVASGMVGALITPVTTTAYSIGLAYTLKGFMAAIVGGLGNLKGAVLGGLAVGLVENLASGMISSAWRDPIVWIGLALVLTTFPHGLFASMVEEQTARV